MTLMHCLTQKLYILTQDRPSKWLASRDIDTYRFYMTAILEVQDGRLLPSG